MELGMSYPTIDRDSPIIPLRRSPFAVRSARGGDEAVGPREGDAGAPLLRGLPDDHRRGQGAQDAGAPFKWKNMVWKISWKPL